MIFSPDGRQRLLFIEVPEARTVKNRLHLDLVPTDASREAEVERLVAAWVRPRSPTTAGPTAAAGSPLADPEGNELCVLRSELDRPDPYAHLLR